MAAPPARARADYDYLIKLLLIGDSGVGKSCLLLRFSDGSFTTSFITTIGLVSVDFFPCENAMGSFWLLPCVTVDIKMHISMFPPSRKNLLSRLNVAAYYRGAMGILLVYDVTDEASFNSTLLPWLH
ncbi:Small GTPase superfamily [Sesbania bispinosa]|nr:Small GTPase superfamily [Sesbania bispinosa]